MRGVEPGTMGDSALGAASTWVETGADFGFSD
jgi:hypothetical protein